MPERDHGVLGRIGLAHELSVEGSFDETACRDLRGGQVGQRVAAVGSAYLQLAELAGVLVHIGQLRVVVQIRQMPRKIRGIGRHAHRVVVDVHLAVQKFDDDARAGLVPDNVVHGQFDVAHERNLGKPDADVASSQHFLDLRHGFEIAEKVKREVGGSQSLRGIGSGASWRLRPGQFVGAERQPLVIGRFHHHIDAIAYADICTHSQHGKLCLEGQAGLVLRRHGNDLGSCRDIRHLKGHHRRVFHRLRAVDVALLVGDHQRRASPGARRKQQGSKSENEG